MQMKCRKPLLAICMMLRTTCVYFIRLCATLVTHGVIFVPEKLGFPQNKRDLVPEQEVMDTTITSKKIGAPANTMLQWLLVAWQRSFTEWRYRVSLHVLFWLFLLFFWMRESIIIHIEFSQNIATTLTGIALSLFIFYPLVYGIVPLLIRKKWGWAILAFAGYYFVAMFLRTYHISLLVANVEGNAWFAGQDFWQHFKQHQLQPYQLISGFFSGITGLVSIIYIPLGIKFLRFAYTAYQQRLQLEKENLQLELNFLKAQVNPHLLFNSLNNLQSYILHNEPDRAIELVTRLAGLLRFSLYESNNGFVTLQQEVELLKNYIAVERVRYDDDADVQIKMDVEGGLSYPLPALLVMPLVENAFKYGSGVADPHIEISLQTQNDRFILMISNTYERAGFPEGGIGIINVKKRLQHYFPGRHELRVEDDQSLFTAHLIIHPHEMHHR